MPALQPAGTYKWKVHKGKIEIISFVVVSFLTAIAVNIEA
jgi:hypothetical protein